MYQQYYLHNAWIENTKRPKLYQWCSFNEKLGSAGASNGVREVGSFEAIAEMSLEGYLTAF